MTILIAIFGVCVFAFGTTTAIDRGGHIEMVSPRAAGCGAAVFLAIVCSQVLA